MVRMEELEPALASVRFQAQEAEEGLLGTIESNINSFFDPVATGLGDFVFAEVTVFGTDFPWIVAWLVLAGLVFTLYFGFIQVRGLKLALQVLRGRHSKPEDPGEITHFQALTSAVSGTVGLGNIAGVGVAVTIGGAGATFWMVLCGLLGMASKFTECTLGVRYRDYHPDGSVSGGPMQYLRKGVAERIPGAAGAVTGKILAGLAAVMILFFGLGGGNMFQANQTVSQIRNSAGGDDGPLAGDGSALIMGVVLAVVVGAVIVGGIKSIGRVTSRLVPSMAIIYVVACLIVILFNITSVPAAFGEIFSGAFTGEGVVGGVIGALIVGFTRAAFSNEAGLGSAPIAHSAVKTKYPATEGLVALFEPFIDTVVICTMTALTIVIADTGYWNDTKAEYAANGTAVDGVTVTSEAFETVLPWFPHVLTVAVVLFAVSTMITWAYYGQKAWTHLFGRSKVSERIFQLIFCAFIVIGAVLSFGSVLAFTDAVLFLLALINIIGLYLLAPVVKRELARFRQSLHSRGDATEPAAADETV
ncbi:alanine/glycine:cation symporter family protein [Streptomyces stelliscabiei]|nr:MULTISPECIES: alanine/glycine:cation symporter family protein [Streptomyces]KFG09894.1 D-alanine glycine permease [Streptomyces scabiei]MDX2520261.1 alanine/glycine:cation symporter family protein [Streptomyces stelliscabiei]MDX2836626.1 alanine/glycine:cation symporter family protein [Streptomyces scabiei]MDX3279456.1 alanine/glycine:cation symporter family protein [Streptomyces scabiei]MDX3681479.1 alanine/glycine:cation symporter family protein [Streptomyces scabiei]